MTVDPAARLPRPRRNARRFAAALLLVFAAVAAAAVYWRLPLSEAALRGFADRRGLSGLSFAVTRLDFRGAMVERVRLGRGLYIAELEPRWAASTLFSRPVGRLRISGLRLDLTEPESFRELLAHAAGAPADGPDGLAASIARLPNMVIEDAVVRLPLPGAPEPGEATLSALAVPDPSGALAVDGRLGLTAGRAQAGAVEATALRIEGPFRARFSNGVATVDLPAPLAVKAEGLAAGPAILGPIALRLTGAASPAASVPVARGRRLNEIAAALRLDTDPATPRLATGNEPLSAPMALAGTIRLAEGTARLDGTISGAGGMPTLRIALRHSLAAGAGSASVTLAPLRLGPGGVQPGAILPAAAQLTAQGGTVRGDAALAWGRGDPRASATFTLDALSLEDAATGTSVAGLSGGIRLDRLVPPKTPPGQRLRANRIEAGAALDDVTLQFQLIGDATDRPAVAVEAFDARFAGGRLSVRDGRFGLAGDGEIRLEVSGVELSHLAQTLGLDDAAGSGKLDGAIPVRMEGGRVGIAGARLAARGPGRLRIESAAVRNALAGAGQEVALMLKALEDFRYDRLSLSLDKPPAGLARLRLETFGRNPAVADGRPFAINLNLETDIDRIAASLAEALRLPGRILGTIVRGRR